MASLVLTKGKKIFLSVLISFLALILLVNITHAYPTTYALNVPSVTQEQTNWCWAASSVATLSYYSINTTQSNFVMDVKGSVSNVTASMNETKTGISDFGKSSTLYSGALSFSSIQSSIYNAKDPIIAGIKWTYGGGHMVVIDGYDDDGVNQYLELMDPGDGSFVYVDYDYFKSNSNYYWHEGLYNFN